VRDDDDNYDVNIAEVETVEYIREAKKSH